LLSRRRPKCNSTRFQILIESLSLRGDECSSPPLRNPRRREAGGTSAPPQLQAWSDKQIARHDRQANEPQWLRLFGTISDPVIGEQSKLSGVAT
jgi:hypothetical protein